MAGGYLSGLDHEDAARFSFLTATPIILGAVVLEGPKLLKHHDSFSGTAVLAGAVAGVDGLPERLGADALVQDPRGARVLPLRPLLRVRRCGFVGVPDARTLGPSSQVER